MTSSFKTLISADSHVMEPRDLWQKAFGLKYGDHTPRIVTEHNGKPGTFLETLNKSPNRYTDHTAGALSMK